MEANENKKHFGNEYFEEDIKTEDDYEEKKGISSVPEGQKFSCPQCGKKFTQNRNLKTHIQSVHEKVKYPCYLCGKQLTRQDHLKTHIQSVHEKVNFSCDQCDKQFTNQGHLHSHVKSVHRKYWEEKKANKKTKKARTYTCTLCGFETKQNSNLKTHIMIKHNLKTFQCDLCDFTNHNKYVLNRHRRDHNREKDIFKCDSCDFEAKTKGTIKTHYNSVHLGIKYPCDVCPYKAKSKSVLSLDS